MAFRETLTRCIGLTWFLSLVFTGSDLHAFAKGDDLVELTILYTGDEYGYLEPCG